MSFLELAKQALAKRENPKASPQHPPLPWPPDDLRDPFEERAAIKEYDACLPRPQAEDLALHGLVERFNLPTPPCPGLTADARRDARATWWEALRKISTN